MFIEARFENDDDHQMIIALAMGSSLLLTHLQIKLDLFDPFRELPILNSPLFRSLNYRADRTVLANVKFSAYVV